MRFVDETYAHYCTTSVPQTLPHTHTRNICDVHFRQDQTLYDYYYEHGRVFENGYFRSRGQLLVFFIFDGMLQGHFDLSWCHWFQVPG